MRWTWRNIVFATFWLFVVLATTYGTFGFVLWLGGKGSAASLIAAAVFGIAATVIGQIRPPDDQRPKTR